MQQLTRRNAFRVFLLVALTGGIVLYGRYVLSERRDSLVGIVTGDDGPLRDALVRIKGTSVCTRTDDRGRFRLVLPDDPSQRSSCEVTASKAGYFIGSATIADGPLEIDLERHTQTDYEGYAWVDPTPDSQADGNCGNCHSKIYDEWKLTAHATSASGMRLRNLYDGSDSHGNPGRGWNLLATHPEGAGVCISCHAPSARDDDLAVGDLRQVSGVPAQGVHCDFCHKMKSVRLDSLGISHGRFAIDLLRPEKGQLFFGPLDDVDRGEDIHSPLQSQSEHCAGCHEGTLFGVPVYETYSEWSASPAARRGDQCQSCHMKPTGDMSNFAPGAGGIERDPATLASHQLFPGGKATALRHCLQLSTEIAKRQQEIEAKITILPRSIGHRAPTGFVDRHLILVVEAQDEQGKTVSVNGPRLPSSAGSLAGRAGVLFGKQLFGEKGEHPIPFWQPVLRIEDTRLYPEQKYEVLFSLPQGTKSLHIRLLYRHFWEQVALDKDWSDNEIVVHDRLQTID
jgi:hypothetical protein